MKLVIDREKWLRGKEAELYSVLLDKESRKMCCLGFYAVACGISDSRIENVCFPCDITFRGEVPSSIGWLIDESADGISDDCAALVGANDSPSMKEYDREAEIAANFAKHDVQVEFIN